MNAQDPVSATAGIRINKDVIQACYWRAFAPKSEDEHVLSLVRQVVENPLFTLKSPLEGVELRFQIEDRLGIVGLLQKSDVLASYPFVRTGFEHDAEILGINSGSSAAEGWVNVRCHGLELSFYDVLHALVEYKAGEKRRFVLNALAISLRRAPRTAVDEVELGFHTHGIRSFIPMQGKRAGEGIFQSPVEGESSITRFEGNKMTLLPISLKETETQSVKINLGVAADILQPLGDAIKPGDDIAGLLWLHGYCPDLLQRRPD